MNRAMADLVWENGKLREALEDERERVRELEAGGNMSNNPPHRFVAVSTAVTVGAYGEIIERTVAIDNNGLIWLWTKEGWEHLQ